MTQKEQAMIYPLPTDALLQEREVAWRVKLPDDYKEFIKNENGFISGSIYRFGVLRIPRGSKEKWSCCFFRNSW